MPRGATVVADCSRLGDRMSNASDAGRALAAHRRRISKRCIVCDAAIEGVVQRQYCSNRCAHRASRARQRAQQPLLKDENLVPNSAQGLSVDERKTRAQLAATVGMKRSNYEKAAKERAGKRVRRVR
jgi:predicted nucleic acid-binding Zn ribbon protein